MYGKVVNVDLLKFKLFIGLKSVDIEHINEKLVCRIKRYSLDQIIVERVEAMESLVLLLDRGFMGEMLVP